MEGVKSATRLATLGTVLFIGLMAGGYAYNLTFVQLGLVDLGQRVLRLDPSRVAGAMALFALLTAGMAVALGFWMDRRGWGRQFSTKMRLTFGVLVLQTLLTVAALQIRSVQAFTVWIIAASIGMGVGVPSTFGMTVDLVPVRWRGGAAAAITAVAYAVGNLLVGSWTIGALGRIFIGPMAAASLVMGWLVFRPPAWIDRLGRQHELARFANGRYVRGLQEDRRRVPARLLGLMGLMFAIYFIDSLGFLRLLDTPSLMVATWQSPDLEPRFILAIVHITAALVGGVLYANGDDKQLFLWIFGVFALTHLLSIGSFFSRSALSTNLAMPMMYAIAVSLYTVVNFAIWADISTPDTISRNTAIGVSISGWLATFLSTGLALVLDVTTQRYLQWVDALAIVFFLAVLLLLYVSGTSSRPTGNRAGEEDEV